MTAKEYLAKIYPLPWHGEYADQPPTRKCHHKTRTWHIYAANGLRVWWTEKTVAAICEVMNANAPAANATAD